MKTGMGLVLIGVGAILAFAVTTNTSVFNLHTAGYVIMIIGILGLAVPRRGYGWVGRRLFVRQARWRPGNRIEEVTYPTSVTAIRRTPACRRACRPRAPSAAPRRHTIWAAASDLATEPTGATSLHPGETEVIEDVYED